MAVELTEFAIGVIVLGIVVTIGSSVFSNFKDAQVTNLPIGYVKSESITPTTNGANFSKTPLLGWGRDVTECINGTAGPTIRPGNYSVTVDPNWGTMTITNNTAASGGEFVPSKTAWICNYTLYNTSDQRYALPDKAGIGLGEYGNWFKIVVIVAISAVILGLIFSAFGRATHGGEGGETSIGGKSEGVNY